MTEMETVKIPKSVLDCVRSNNWFKSYRNIEEVVVEAIRNFLEAKGSANIIHIGICRQNEISGHSIRKGKVYVEVDMDTYREFEKAASRLGMNVDEALGHSIYTLLKG